MKCEIEANVGCCDDCQKKVRRNLEHIRGVESVELYPEINKVVVTGKAEAKTLLRAVKKVKVTARMLTVEASIIHKNFGAAEEERGNRDQNTKKTESMVAAPIDKESIYRKSTGGGKDEIASEATTYGVNLTAYGFGGGISYRKDVTYK